MFVSVVKATAESQARKIIVVINVPQVVPHEVNNTTVLIGTVGSHV